MNILFYIIDLGISPKIQSFRFVLPLRKNMITHSFTMSFLYFLLLVKNKSIVGLSQEVEKKLTLIFSLFSVYIYFFFSMKKPLFCRKNVFV